MNNDTILYSGKRIATPAASLQIFGFASGVLLYADANAGGLSATVNLSAFAARLLARELDAAADALAQQGLVQ